MQDIGRHSINVLAWTSLMGFCLMTDPAIAGQKCPDTVYVTFFEHAVPPLVMESGELLQEPSGALVKWVQKAIASTGCKTRVEMNRRPVRRAYIELEAGKTDLLALGTATATNLRNAAFPAVGGQADTGLAFMRSDNSLWVRKAEPSVNWDGTTLKGPKGFKLGVPGGTANEALARERGWDVDVGVNGTLTTVQLLKGRFPVALVSDVAVMAQPDESLPLLQKLTPAVTQTWYYSPASKGFYTAYPEFVRQYWHGLCTAARADKTFAQSQPLPACGKSTR